MVNQQLLNVDNHYDCSIKYAIIVKYKYWLWGKYKLPLFTLFRSLCPAFAFADVDTYERYTCVIAATGRHAVDYWETFD